MMLLSYLSFLVFLLSLTTGVLALALDGRSSANRTGALAAFVYAIWTGGMTVVFGATDQGVIQAFYRVSVFGALFLTPCVLSHCLTLAGLSSHWKSTWVGASFGFAVIHFVNFSTDGFYYSHFVPTPWGNMGVSPQNVLWSLVNPYSSLVQMVFGLGAMVRAQRRAESQRLRGQIRILVPATVMTLALMFGAWGAELMWGVPNAMALGGIVLIAAIFWAMVRYRYLQKDAPLLEGHLVGVVQDEVFLLDPHGIIVAATRRAHERLGRSDLDFVGTSFSHWLEDKALWAEEWDMAIRGQLLYKGYPCRLDGRTVYLSLTPRFDGFGDLVAIVVLVGDLGPFDQRVDEWGITPREREILLLTLQGRDSEEIADALAISPATVKRHIHNLCEKTGVANRVELMGRLLR